MLVSDDIAILGNDDAGTLACQRRGIGLAVAAPTIAENKTLLADLVVLDADHRGDDLLCGLLAGQAIRGDHRVGGVVAVRVLIQGKGCRFTGAGAFHIDNAVLDHQGENAHRREGDHRAAEHRGNHRQSGLFHLFAVPGLLLLGRLLRCVIRDIVLLGSAVPCVGAGLLGLIAILPAALGGIRVLRTLPAIGGRSLGIPLFYLAARVVVLGSLHGSRLLSSAFRALIFFLFGILLHGLAGVVRSTHVVLIIRIIHKPLLLSKALGDCRCSQGVSFLSPCCAFIIPRLCEKDVTACERFDDFSKTSR